GQGVRMPFSAYSFVARQKSKTASGAATPQPCGLLTVNSWDSPPMTLGTVPRLLTVMLNNYVISI
ncbi:MAG: hypothetical protein QNK24_14410, partial [Desulfuromusa sp.]|nr:hypothetical protein [Desulfuromusa sp.]